MVINVRRFYPLAYIDGKKDPLNTLSTYDSQSTMDECYKIIGIWVSSGYNITECYIQEYDETDNFILHDVPEIVYNGKK